MENYKNVYYVDLQNENENQVIRIYSKNEQNEQIAEKKPYDMEEYFKIVENMRQISKIEKVKSSKDKEYIKVEYEGQTYELFNVEILEYLTTLKRYQEELKNKKINSELYAPVTKSQKKSNKKIKGLALFLAGIITAVGVGGAVKSCKLQKDNPIITTTTTTTIETTLEPKETTIEETVEIKEKREPSFDINNDEDRIYQASKLAGEIEKKYETSVDINIAEDMISILNGRYQFGELSVLEASDRLRQVKNLQSFILDQNQIGKNVVNELEIKLSDYIADPDTAEKIVNVEDLIRNITLQHTKETKAYDGKRETVGDEFSKEYITYRDELLEYMRTSTNKLAYREEKAGIQVLHSQMLLNSSANYIEPTDYLVKLDKNDQESIWRFDQRELYVEEEEKTLVFIPIENPEKKLYVIEGQEDSKKYSEEELDNFGAEQSGIYGMLFTDYENSNANLTNLMLKSCYDINEYSGYLEHLDFLAKTSPYTILTYDDYKANQEYYDSQREPESIETEKKVL